MKVAIVHYHLNPGGVTRVIENAVTSIRDHDIQTVVISGAPYPGDQLPCTRTVSKLGYTSGTSKTNPVVLADDLEKAATEALGATPDVWHIHNHSLGKNNAMADAVALLADRQHALLLQMHDYAEDGRPTNYAGLMQHLITPDNLYPGGTHVHFATLNSRDRSILLDAGAKCDRLHLIPNAVSIPEITELSAGKKWDKKPLAIYPTRAIRRKNMGEFVLWSALESDTLFAASAAPGNPESRPIHDRWEAFSAELKLPVQFDTVNKKKIPFLSLLQMADTIISTSVAEGFGLAFLEPWLLGKALVGRDIPDITKDFKCEGIELSTLYESLYIPLELIDTDEFKRKLEEQLKLFYEAYDQPFDSACADTAYAAATQDTYVDFGRLDESLQESVIRAVVSSPDLKTQILPNKLHKPDNTVLNSNRERTIDGYSLATYGDRLAKLYRDISASPRHSSDGILADNVLSGFLKPERFNLLRT